MKGTTVLMQPVGERCNSRCDYCYNFEAFARMREHAPKMTLDTVERVARGLVESDRHLVILTWHGGEPLLRGIQFYKDVIALQGRLMREFPHVQIRNGMQSNLTLLNEEWCEFFAANHFSIGASLDGWASLHNAHRKYSDGRGQFEDTDRGVNLAKKYNILGGFIAVINDQTVRQDPKRFFDFLMGTYPRSEIVPCWGTGSEAIRTDYTITNEQFLEFATKLFDIWWETNDPKNGIRMFHGFMQALLGGQEYTCLFKGNCGDFIGVEANGDVYTCGKFVGITEFRMGNIHNKSISEMLEEETYKNFVSRRIDLPNQCKNCQWGNVCHNGCSYERYLGGQQFAEVSPHCEVWNGLYTHVNRRIEALKDSQASAF